MKLSEIYGISSDDINYRRDNNITISYIIISLLY